MIKRVLIVEDQAIVRKGIRMMVEMDDRLEVVAEAEDGEEALRQMEKEWVDLVLLDIHLPKLSGIEVTKKLKARWPDVKILILTTFNDDSYAMETLKDGANGFLLKTAEPQKLIEAIHSVLSGGLVLNEEVAAKMMPKLLVKSRETANSVPLTERERSIVRLVGEGKTNKEIAAALYLSVGTVKNHITHILHTLELRDRTQLALYAVRKGLVD